MDLIFQYFLKICRENCAKNNGYTTWRPVQFDYKMSLNSSWNEKYFKQTFLGQIKTHILGYTTWRPVQFDYKMLLNSSWNEKYFKQTFWGQIKTHILYSKHLPGIRAV
jgi:hypothetical protein